jgi:hypothetical protein
MRAMPRILTMMAVIFGIFSFLNVAVADVEDEIIKPIDRSSRPVTWKKKVFEDAWRELNHLGFTWLMDRPESRVRKGYNVARCHGKAASCFVVDTTVSLVHSYRTINRGVYTGRKWRSPDGTYQYEYVPVQVQVPYTYSETRIDRALSMTNLVFDQGYLNLDSAGDVFWNDDEEDSLYGKSAVNVTEAAEFCILHELAHFGGLSDTLDAASNYARLIILELRKLRAGMPCDPGFRRANAYFREHRYLDCRGENPVRNHSYIPSGPARSRRW